MPFKDLEKRRAYHKEYNKKWYAKHPNYQRERHKNHPEIHRRECREWEKRHPEKGKRWKIEHPKIIKAQFFAYYYVQLGLECELCPEDEKETMHLQRHHPDYDYPTICVTTCVRCHYYANKSTIEI